MQITANEMIEFSKLIAGAVVTILEDRGLVGSANTPSKPQKTAYQKTEQLLYNYNNFRQVVADREREIEEIRKYGVPQRSCSIVEYTPSSGTVQGISTVQEDVERAVHTVQASVQGTVQALALIDKCMATLKNDPYYDILVMLYFEGRTMEDIGMLLNCGVATVSRNRSRLVRELSIRLFPDQVVEEYMK